MLKNYTVWYMKRAMKRIEKLCPTTKELDEVDDFEYEGLWKNLDYTFDVAVKSSYIIGIGRHKLEKIDHKAFEATERSVSFNKISYLIKYGFIDPFSESLPFIH